MGNFLIYLLNGHDNPGTRPAEGIGEWFRQNAWTIVNIALLIVGSMAGLFAIWLGVRLATASDENRRTQAKAQIIWSILAVIITFSLAGVFYALEFGQYDVEGGIFPY